MATSPAAGELYLRKASLFVYNPNTFAQNNPSAYDTSSVPIDLSGFHFKFHTSQDDEQSPNNCSIRVYNLSAETMRTVREEYSRVVLQAGYQNGPFGVIFDGTVKQLRLGRENNTTTYLDILAADGDVGYNWAVLKTTLAASSTVAQRVEKIVDAMKPYGITPGDIAFPDTGGVLPRGKVLFGYAKGALAQVVQTKLSTWSIQNGKIQIIPLDGFLQGDPVILTSRTGLIGRPEQTQEGVKAKCLLNPAIVVGGTVKIDNASINQTQSASGSQTPGAQQAYNSYTAFQRFATVTADGLYRVYVAEHEGDTRGTPWYTNIICLTVNPVTGKVEPYGYN
jgi:hypothetical protein